MLVCGTQSKLNAAVHNVLGVDQNHLFLCSDCHRMICCCYRVKICLSLVPSHSTQLVKSEFCMCCQSVAAAHPSSHVIADVDYDVSSQTWTIADPDPDGLIRLTQWGDGCPLLINSRALCRKQV